MTPLFELAQRLRGLVTRGTVTAAKVAKRTILDVSGLAGETAQKVELILPYGMSARPDAGDVLLLQVCGSRAHLVAVGADKAGLHIADLAAGEFGFQDGQSQKIVFRQDKIEVDTPLKLTVTAAAVEMSVSGNVTISAGQILLGGAGGKAVAVDGDPVLGGVIQASTTVTKAK